MTSEAKVFVNLLSLKCYLFQNQMDFLVYLQSATTREREREEKKFILK